MNEQLRGTGRTTRMIERACQDARHGRAVYILVQAPGHIKLWEDMVQKLWDHPQGDYAGTRHGIKVESMQHWEEHRLWDWNEMRPSYNSYHPNCLFLVDHFAVEKRLAQIHADIKFLATLAGKLYPHTV